MMEFQRKLKEQEDDERLPWWEIDATTLSFLYKPKPSWRFLTPHPSVRATICMHAAEWESYDDVKSDTMPQQFQVISLSVFN